MSSQSHCPSSNSIPKPSESPGESGNPLALTPQQRHLTSSSLTTRFAVYRDLIVGDSGWGTLVGFELATLLFVEMPGLLGIMGRSFAYRVFFQSLGKGVVFGRGVTIRQPRRISIGHRTVVDDYAVLDVRSPALSANPTARDTDFGIEIGERVIIGRGSIVTTKGARIILRAGANIGSYCRVACRSNLEIGESTLVAAYCYLGCGNHGYSDLSRPIMEQPMEIRGPVRIGRNCWIGTRATIVDGVTIGDDAIVGAHSLVLEDVPPRAIVAGTPARLIRYRE